eukprot:CAMPEP_0202965426 /NCGR_PEP_ID=MMETSP1396-20130829/9402_1 /ASSEMBLY_ACC=CAM_ASM_000872 /TAXON_ID= /ORGANISM="Pseudokeronopsis sp., Strain Brazil" /LENGTH=320 /DNA_ID=CAMNT_0049688135 /DNA_START=156 /DNA_END=1119 /DNA_ORIENTATION=-
MRAHLGSKVPSAPPSGLGGSECDGGGGGVDGDGVVVVAWGGGEGRPGRSDHWKELAGARQLNHWKLNQDQRRKSLNGDNVYVGPNVTLDNCTLENFCNVGMGATVHSGAVVESFAMVAAGAVVAPGTVVPSGQIWAGNPARYLRDLTQEEKHYRSEHHLEMQEMASVYYEATEKSFREQIAQRDEFFQYRLEDPEDKVFDELSAAGMPMTHDDFEYIEHRIYHDYVGTLDFDIQDPATSPEDYSKSWRPYEQDLSHYPEVFRGYGENYKIFEQRKKQFEEENVLEEQPESAYKPKMPRDMSPWEKKYDDFMPKYTGTSHQ